MNAQKGFTLIELMIVVAIIGILAAIAIPAYSNYIKKSHDGACMAEVKGYANDVYTWVTDPNKDTSKLPAYSGKNCAAPTGYKAATTSTAADLDTAKINAKPVDGTGKDVICDLAKGASCALGTATP